jgi:hypothetical protein
MLGRSADVLSGSVESDSKSSDNVQSHHCPHTCCLQTGLQWLGNEARDLIVKIIFPPISADELFDKSDR